MKEVRNSRVLRAIPLLITVCLFSFPAQAKYSGGTGEPNDPYQIATSEDLMLLGSSPEDYDKHFILIADIDLNPNLPNSKIFDRAVIAPDTNDVKNGFQGARFYGVFNANGHRILNLTIRGVSYLGLFGRLAPEGLISNLGLETIDVNGETGDYVGGLVGVNGDWEDGGGYLTNCYSTGTVTGGGDSVGGLVGENYGSIAESYSSGTISGDDFVGGLAGRNYTGGTIINSYSTGSISGDDFVGGLVGENLNRSVTVSYSIAKSYSSAAVNGANFIGGLAGSNEGNISNCYSTGSVSGFHSVGGFVGINGYLRESAMAGGISEIWGVILNCYSTGYVMPTSRSGGLVGINAYGEAVNSFWDIETSGQTNSEGGTGLNTAEMQDIDTYLNAVWDFVGEIEKGLHEIWQMPGEGGYPMLSVFNDYQPPTLSGKGTTESPYLISTAKELGAVIYQKQGACYRLTQDIDLSGITWSTAVIRNLEGTFDGNDFAISNLTIVGPKPIGIIGTIKNSGQVMNLGVVDANVSGTGGREVGILVGSNYGIVKNSHSTGTVSGIGKATGGWGWIGGIGGLVGCNNGSITTSYNSGSVSGDVSVGGLVGLNYGNITMSYSTVSVSGSEVVGGLVGLNYDGSIATSYSNGTVAGIESVGGLVGSGSNITKSYSASTVIGEYLVGGLVGDNWGDTSITSSFWDVETAGLITSDGVNGKTTAEMQTASTFLKAGWDFIDETANGTDDIWWILEGQDYPRLWWEEVSELEN
jgi:hypothetical protein